MSRFSKALRSLGGLTSRLQLRLLERRLPPEHLRIRVAGTPDVSWFVQSGLMSIDDWSAALAAVDRRFSNFAHILDFGCGCGRVLGPLAARMTRGQSLAGVDPDGEAVAWLQAHHRNAATHCIGAMPPLPFDSQSFDLVLNHSVFTHLPEDVQLVWLDELVRVIAPQGFAVLSFHGEWAFDEMVRGCVDADPTLVEGYRRAMSEQGFLYISARSEAEQSLPDYYGKAFHTISYIMRHWGARMQIRAWLPRRALAYQDVVVLQKEA